MATVLGVSIPLIGPELSDSSFVLLTPLSGPSSLFLSFFLSFKLCLCTTRTPQTHILMDQLLLALVGPRKDPEEERKFLLLNIFTCLLCLLSTSYLAFAFWLGEDRLSACCVVSYINIGSCCLLLLLVKAKVNLSVACAIFCVLANFVMFLGNLLYQGVEGWFCLTPLFASYVFGNKVGLLFYAITVCESLPIFYIRSMGVLPQFPESIGIAHPFM